MVRRLEAGGLTLEQSLELWERGEKLAAICAEWLDGARARLTAAMAASSDGTAGRRTAAGQAAASAPQAGRRQGRRPSESHPRGIPAGRRASRL